MVDTNTNSTGGKGYGEGYGASFGSSSRAHPPAIKGIWRGMGEHGWDKGGIVEDMGG